MSAKAGPNFAARCLRFWFNGLQPNQLPSRSLQQLWFNKSPTLNRYLRLHYETDLLTYIQHKSINSDTSSYLKLENEPYGALALTILLSEFTPRILQHCIDHPSVQTELNEYDVTDSNMLAEDAAVLCWLNITKEYDYKVAPIERTFFLTPLIRHNTEQSLLSAEIQCDNYIKDVPRWAKPWYQHMKQYIVKQQNTLIVNKQSNNTASEKQPNNSIPTESSVIHTSNG